MAHIFLSYKGGPAAMYCDPPSCSILMACSCLESVQGHIETAHTCGGWMTLEVKFCIMVI